MLSLSKHFSLLIPALMAAAAAAGCSGREQPATGADSVCVAFATDSVGYTDTVAGDGQCRVTVRINGLYPSQKLTSALADSVRLWLATRLQYFVNTDNVSYTPGDYALNDGALQIKSLGESLVAAALGDFSSFATDSIVVNYDYSASFRPIFESDSLLTYSYSNYVYLGGAHGGATGFGQTFNRNNGDRLTFNNSFTANSLSRLIDLIKRELWTQYFSDPAAGGESLQGLQDALIVNPDSVKLPVCPPEFTADGVRITYQQYEIACYAAGMPSCVLPYDAVKPLLTPEAASLIPAHD